MRPTPSGVHNERAHVILGRRIGLEVGNVVADPALLRFVPPDLARGRIPRFARDIAGSAIVENTAVHGPRPSPVRMDSKPRRIRVVAALRQRAGFGPGAAPDPVAAVCRAVVAQAGEAWQLLAGFIDLLRL